MASYTARIAIKNEGLNALIASQIIDQYLQYTPLRAPMVGDQALTNEEIIARFHEATPSESSIEFPEMQISSVFGFTAGGVVCWAIDLECSLAELDEFVRYCRALKIKFAITECDGRVWFGE